jgi:cytochrome c-type biogenesis protein
MTADPLATGLGAAATGSPAAFGWVFVAGVITSIGPCVAPRFIAVAALANGARRPWPALAAYISGIIAAYVALGFAAGAVGLLFAWSAHIDALLAVALGAGGLVTIARATPARSCADHRADRKTAAPAGIGAAFLLGIASTAVISPCCTPLVAAIASLASTTRHPLASAALLAVFALGHAAALIAAAATGSLALLPLRRFVSGQAPAIVAGGLMLCLGAFYGVLA